MNDNFSYNTNMLKEMIISKYKLNFVETIPKELINNDSIEFIMDELSNRFLFRFETFIASTNQTKETTVEHKLEPKITTEEKSFFYPKTWWDKFKFEYFPQWLILKFPINFAYETFTCVTNIQNTNIVTTTINETKLCPHIKMENEKECLKFLSS